MHRIHSRYPQSNTHPVRRTLLAHTHTHMRSPGVTNPGAHATDTAVRLPVGTLCKFYMRAKLVCGMRLRLCVCARTGRLCECAEPEVKWHVHFLKQPSLFEFSSRPEIQTPAV